MIHGPLTSLEQRILALLLAGQTNQEIADNLYLSHYTVRDYVSKLLGKFGVRSRVQLITLLRDRAQPLSEKDPSTQDNNRLQDLS